MHDPCANPIDCNERSYVREHSIVHWKTLPMLLIRPVEVDLPNVRELRQDQGLGRSP